MSSRCVATSVVLLVCACGATPKFQAASERDASAPARSAPDSSTSADAANGDADHERAGYADAGPSSSRDSASRGPRFSLAPPAPSGYVPVFRWRFESDFFYTRDVQGEMAAELGYRYEGTAFYLRPTAGTERKPIYRLVKQIHHYTVDTAERQKLLADGWRDEGVLGYLDIASGPGLRPLHGYFNRAQHRFMTLYPEQEGVAIGSLGYTHEGVLGYAASTGDRPRSPYRVGAYYFGMFSPAAFAAGTFEAGKVYGAARANDWWAGVRDLYQANLPSALAEQYPITKTWWAEDWSHMRPVIGYYDQADPATLVKHIRQAKSNGLAFFNFYWYWGGQTESELLGDGLDSFLQATQTEPFDFMLGICAHGWHLTIPRDQIGQLVSLLVRKYLARDNYLRTSDGRPIVQLIDGRGIWNWKSGQATKPPDEPDSASIRAFIDALRRECRQVLGKQIVLTLRMDNGSYRTLVRQLGDTIDAGSCLVPVIGETHGVIADGITAWIDGQSAGKPVMPCMPHDFDSRPRVGIMRSPDQVSYLKTFDISSFRRGLRNIKSWMDQHRDSELSQFLTVYAWNEWHEGGVIEPNARDQALYLNALSDTFQLPIAAHPCRITGDCPAPAD